MFEGMEIDLEICRFTDKPTAALRTPRPVQNWYLVCSRSMKLSTRTYVPFSGRASSVPVVQGCSCRCTIDVQGATSGTAPTQCAKDL